MELEEKRIKEEQEKKDREVVESEKERLLREHGHVLS